MRKMVCTHNVEWNCRNRFTRKWPWSKKKPVIFNGPKKDETVTVESEYWSEGKCFYRLVEWPVRPDGGYESSFFKPLQESTTDYKEVTFEKIKKEVPATSAN